MRAVALNDADDAHPDLNITTEAGRIHGRWQGAAPIRAGDVLDVELELMRPRRWSEVVFDGDTAFGGPVGPTMIRGRILAVYEDGVTILQVGSAVMQLEMLDDPSTKTLGQTVSIAADDLKFYPTGI
ncbi:hypothetical protein I6A84_29775 [Frankia sp. CNm7]|uniref:Uncharacterized protein n=1 Tax=Frankia nepalensis TaxID=1836974 RepID=A0A937UNE9_9ACTN|nr:hypothetical protein [Frankia nepalensis]MBL7500539.1 hypothetical protein [Frankia nepalensis]MBL7509767.1 hypothetical protein [Frankia nepalensis]MBL7522153.1 hypothetical protein [Frankia nepalensis]MBL7627887.1 hypothetical protein [Frankia nepalensis]